jgi:hypothetical protein
MNSNTFLSKDNINMLWDVISDEDIFKSLHRDAQTNTLNIFSTNMKGFYQTEKPKTNDLVEMNKKYILLILNYIKNTFSSQNHNKIKIYEEPVAKELITYEEIHNDRKSQFEKDLGRLQEEFSSSMSLQVPDVPDFADKHKDIPISEMDKMIKEITAKRNYDVEQINRTYQEYNTNTSHPNNWLKPQETSIKTDKFAGPKVEEPIQNAKKLKYVNIEQYDSALPKRNVTWGEDTHILETENKDEVEDNIFKKLKKVANANANANVSINDTANTNASATANTNEIRISKLEKGLDILNQKVDVIIDLLKQNK